MQYDRVFSIPKLDVAGSIPAARSKFLSIQSRQSARRMQSCS
jgi:hypothetical protein